MKESNFNKATMRVIAVKEIEAVVTATVKEDLQGLGLDVEKPIETQENFVNLRQWSRMKRNIMQTAFNLIFKTVLLAIIILIVIGFHDWLSGDSPLL